MRTVALGEIVDFYSGGTPAKSNPEYWRGNVPWFSAKDLKRPRLSDSADHISSDVFRATSLRMLPAGTIAMVVRGMILAHTVPISILDVDAAINQDLKALLPKREIDSSFLAAMLRAQHANILSLVGTAAHGTRKLDTRVLEEIRVPLPSVEEQQRIAAILDRADAIRAKRRRMLAYLDSLAQGLLLDMFGHVTATRPLSSLVEEFRYGTSNKSGPMGLPTLRIPNIVGGGIDHAEIKTVVVNESELDRLALRDGDLLFVRTNGNPDNIGRCAVFTESAVADAGFTDSQWIFASYLIRARLREPDAAPFLATYLATPGGRKHLRDRAKTSAGQYNVNIESIGSVPVPDVSHAGHITFTSRLRLIEDQRAKVHSALVADDELFASLQSRAFRGEL
ncbi:restriction endonuclease subunit S [Agromyces sp. NPDC058104]|uniref:restriction endonuclease subunit S n=1 Tax=Agromyces sp. NPDC058104 TaxID=3346342 RepID=UPI0036DB0225